MSVQNVANFEIDGKSFPCVESPKYGRLLAPKTFADLCYILSKIENPNDSQSNEISYPTRVPNGWRGQANIGWDLESSAYRRLKNAIKNSTNPKIPNTFSLGIDEAAMITYEDMLLNQAKFKGFHYKDGRLLNELEILASIQHYGGATRLFDFTQNVFIALWFACRDVNQLDEMGILFCADLNPSSRIFTSLRTFDDASHRVHDLLRIHHNKILVWEPSHLFERMRVQQSLFFFGKVYENTWTCLTKDKFFNDDNPLNTDGGFLAIAISAELKKEMSKNWTVLFGYDFKTIFPDIEGFGMQHYQGELFNFKDFDI